MTVSPCPVCGTQCRIAGDPSSVTRWYEPLGQVDAIKETLRSMGMVTDLLSQRTLLQSRIVELEAEKAANGGRFRVTQTIQTPDLVIEEGPDVLCICGHPRSVHDDPAGCYQRVNTRTAAGTTVERYCDCDEFNARTVAE